MRRFAELLALRREADESFRAAAGMFQAVQDFKAIDGAKQVLMDREHIAEAEAARRLQQWAEEQGKPLSAVAETILAEAGRCGSGLEP
jgi:AmiR/NasT family two-component response regulator